MRPVGCLCVLFVCCATARSADHPDWEKHVFAGRGSKLPYRLHLPEPFDPKQKYPLVLYLHGSGARGNDNTKQLGGIVKHLASKASQKKHPCFVIAPQCSAKNFWAPTVATGAVAGLLNDVIKTHPIDRKRVYATGVSDGGWGVWALLELSPNLLAAGVPICGRGEPKAAARMVSIPIWVFHGKKDNVEPVKSSRDMVAAIQKVGGHPKYTEYPDEGHNCWDKAFKTPELITWIFEQKRN